MFSVAWAASFRRFKDTVDKRLPGVLNASLLFQPNQTSGETSRSSPLTRTLTLAFLSSALSATM